MKPLWLFLHLPRTSGHQFTDEIAAAVGEDRLVRMQPSVPDRTHEKAWPLVHEGIEWVAGHFGVRHIPSIPGRDIRIVTILREPRERLVSHWRLDVSRGCKLGLIQFSDKVRSPCAWRLRSESRSCIPCMRDFAAVGFLDQREEFLRRVSDLCGTEIKPLGSRAMASPDGPEFSGPELERAMNYQHEDVDCWNAARREFA